MKKLIAILSLILLTTVSKVNAQGIQPGCVSGNFGVDADVHSNRLQFISGTASGTDDWIKTSTYPGAGVSIIDTTGAAAIYNYFNSNAPNKFNYTFIRSTPYAYYESVNGNRLLDGIFYKDFYGGSGYKDSTSFTSSKNGDNPTNWSTTISSVGGKTDIIDIYGHIRRLGNSINGQMWLFCAASILDPTGARYLDFEFYQKKLSFNGINFTNVGPHEGHTAYLFDAQGNITQAGDVIFSVNAGSNGEPNLELRIWVARTTFATWLVTPPASLPFKFSGSFDGSSGTSTYGYATIIQKSGTLFDACGKANITGSTPSPPWGTIASGTNFGLSYSTDQFIELGFNLSSLGLDPLTIASGADPCGLGFNSFFVKTRTSNSFTSNLADFAGPLDFGGAPVYTVNITANATISCDNAPVVLKASVNPKPSGNLYHYTWTLPNGTTQSGTQLDSITVTQAGTYTVGVSPINGCKASATATYNLVVDTKPLLTSPFPTASPLCYGRGTRVTITPGNGSASCSDATVQWSMDGGAWQNYISGTQIGANANDSIEIRAVRNCAVQCASRTTLLKWNITKPQVVIASGSLFPCINSSGYIGSLTSTNPSPSTGVWSVISGPGTVASTTSFSTTIGSLSKIGQTTKVGWIVTNSSGCKDTAVVNFSPPAMDSSMISKYSNEFCLTCPIQDGNTFSYYDLNGKLLARVTDSADAINIGPTTFCGQLPYNVSGNPAASDVRTINSWINGVGFLPQPFLPRAWNINTTSNAPMTIQLYFTDQEVAALKNKTMENGGHYYFDDAPDLYLMTYQNKSDTFIPAGAPNGVVYKPVFSRVNGYWQVTFNIPYSATFYLYPSYYPFTALPVELIELSAKDFTNTIIIKWTTASEKNNAKFEIERSIDGYNFNKIGEVTGSGNSIIPIKYQFTDHAAEVNIKYYYRLNQVDFDGKNTITKIVSAIIKKEDNIEVGIFIPNPSNNYSFIKINNPKSGVFNFEVFDTNGLLVMEKRYLIDKGISDVKVDFTGVANGLYLVSISSESGAEMRKIAVKH